MRQGEQDNFRSSADSPRHGFTLVELLVVLGIISLLISLLLPAVARVRRQALAVQCMSNMRQISNALMLHAVDRKGYLPLGGYVIAKDIRNVRDNRIQRSVGDWPPRKYRWVYAGGNQIGTPAYVPMPWPAALASYLDRRFTDMDDNMTAVQKAFNDSRGLWRLFACPATNTIADARFDPAGNRIPSDQVGVTYLWYLGSSTVLVMPMDTDYLVNDAVFGLDGRGITHRLQGKVSDIRMPAQVVLFTDGAKRPNVGSAGIPVTGGTVSTGSAIPGPAFWSPQDGVPDPTTFNNGSGGTQPRAYALGDAWSDPDSSLSRVQDARSFDRPRHSGRINIAFADGHVEARRLEPGDLSDAYLAPPP
jgi:prepilin-type processing-associated H-X9-DG protein/prepilin-type N-terminal cleavage/methylation domain-containing protein